MNGKETDAWGLKKGMTVSATKVTETPLTSVSQHQQVTGTMPAGEPVLIAKGAPTPAPAQRDPLLLRMKQAHHDCSQSCRRRRHVGLSWESSGSF